MGALLALLLFVSPPGDSSDVFHPATSVRRPRSADGGRGEFVEPRTSPPALSQDAYSYYLVGIEVAGTRRLSRQHVIGLAGLRTGRSVTSKDIEAAKTRLVATGLFSSVGYRLRTTGGGYSVIVTFSVVEPTWEAPVFFDNFVGLTDVQLTQAVAADVPTFDGFVPEQQAALERVKTALEKLLRDSGERGAVSYQLVEDRLLDVRRYRFRLERASGPLPVCAVLLNTPSAARGEMMARAAPLLGSDYSRDFIMRFAAQNLLAIEHRDGYLRARLGELDAVRENVPGGCDGVRVTVTIDEGIQYLWRAATWTGNVAFASPDLDRMLGMTAGERVDPSKIDRGARSVAEAYRNKGYLDVLVHPALVLDDAQHQVAGAIEIREGARFRMGKIEIVGPDAAAAERLKKLWQIPEGTPFDPSYASRFAAEARALMRDALASFKTVDVRLNRHAEAGTVDVVLTFRTATH